VARLGSRRPAPTSTQGDGCQDITILESHDDRANIASLTTWTTRQHYAEYLAWRTEIGDTDTFEQLLDQPMSIRYFDQVELN
jgi:hypothetical protein